jgi:hypothetical protein
MIEPESKRWIVITVVEDGPPTVDAQGFDSWGLYTILSAAANATWDSLPDAVVVNVRER